MEITVTASLIVACLSLAFTFYRETAKKHSITGKEQATIEVKLDMIATDLAEIKAEIQTVRKDWMKDHEIIIGMQKEVAAIWKLIDRMKELNPEITKDVR